MKTKTSFAVVLITAPGLPVARKLARAALAQKLIACANLIRPIESHYWWQGKIERSREVLLICKTTRTRIRSLEGLIRREHPYDTPEFLVLPVVGGAARYLAWLADAVG